MRKRNGPKKIDPSLILRQYLTKQLSYPDAIALTLVSPGSLKVIFVSLAALVQAERGISKYTDHCAYLH